MSELKTYDKDATMEDVIKDMQDKHLVFGITSDKTGLGIAFVETDQVNEYAELPFDIWFMNIEAVNKVINEEYAN